MVDHDNAQYADFAVEYGAQARHDLQESTVLAVVGINDPDDECPRADHVAYWAVALTDGHAFATVCTVY